MVYSFEIERLRHFFPVLCVIVAGFAIHAWLPVQRKGTTETAGSVDGTRGAPAINSHFSGPVRAKSQRIDLRLTFFALLCVGCVLFLLGIVNGLSVLGIGGLLIGICYLPVTHPWRVGLLIVAATLLVALRVVYPFPFWPVLGSMFMFRLITFVYESHRQQTTPSVAWALSYFFMLPNTCFPLFPIVDFKTFVATRYDQDEWLIYQRGVEWIVRGLVHLLIYRFMKAYVVPDLSELYEFTRISLFAATNYALYLQVSGHFHLVTGLLHLFGFNLPRTHHGYFLASSFSDIWRRINIYWKDFMAKYVFYPSFYALRRRRLSISYAMFVSVLLVFLSTWVLHSWQTFWLLGRFPLTVNDGCLWLGTGLLVAVNSLLDSRRHRVVYQSPFLRAFVTSVQTVGMFCLVSIFWSCWTKPGFLQLVASALERADAVPGIARVLMVLLIAVGLGTVLLWFLGQREEGTQLVGVTESGGPLQREVTGPGRDGVVVDQTFRRSVSLHLAFLSLMIAFISPGFSGLLPDEFVRAISQFRHDPTLELAAGEKLQSYYEDLNTAAIQAGPLLSSLFTVDGPQQRQGEGFLKISRQADVYQGVELIPGIRTELDGQPFSVNEFGMRDRNSLTFQKPEGTCRIAVVGSSIVMGYGVADDTVFSHQFENLLNQALPRSAHRFEVLNFGVGKQWAVQRTVRIQRKVFGFSPDAVFYFAHQDEFKELATPLAQLVSYRKELPSDPLKEVATQAGVTSRQPPGEVLSRLTRFNEEILRACYLTIVDECRRFKAVPVWIYLPIPGADDREIREKLFPIATEAGFIVCDLSGWTKGETELFPGTEYHPNAHGHTLVAEALLNQVRSNPKTLPEDCHRDGTTVP
ncbi:SGNH/GDSL hydrolase family protein [Schlesneria sp.]|uniref:SGNH/GDSL hydrolase family protein n=1 Tax=Schlesneria sp. TaxID=2762018 RepID=UPI002EDC0511